MSLRIGITGGIGSGKTTISGIFQVLGIPVFDADAEARKIMENNPELRNAIIEKFGPLVYPDNIHLDRKALAAIVFKDAFQLEVLNSLVEDSVDLVGLIWLLLVSMDYRFKQILVEF